MKRRISILLGGTLAAAAVLAPQASAAPTASAAATQCPAPFTVLHNDSIGPAVLPQGSYMITVIRPGLQCGQASSLFTQFLQDYDGRLPSGWQVVAQGSGRAQFNQNGEAGFRVQRTGGGGQPSKYGTACPGSFQVLHNDMIGPLSFPKGSYRVVIPRGVILNCGQAFKLFKQFLNRPAGDLPKNWRMKPSIALFFKPGNAKRKKFRVDPAT
jgi:hypothetical protein